MTDRDYRFGFSGTDLISPLQFEFDPDQKYRLPMALDHALYRLEEVQGEINAMIQSYQLKHVRKHVRTETFSTDGSPTTRSN